MKKQKPALCGLPAFADIAGENMNELYNVNDGIADATAVLQKLLDKGGIVEIPQGSYRVTSTLYIHSDTFISAHRQARIFMCGDTPKASGDFLISNSDTENGNVNISVTGGIWDGNNQGRMNDKKDIFDLSGYSGAVMNFCNVKRLELRSMILANSVTYNIRMARIDDFLIEDIGFISDVPAYNQDGLHFNGECRNGTIRRITALSNGQTNDDMIAFNADDSLERVENVGMVRGNIENITVEDVYAENCHTIIRLLSVTSAIRNISIKNVWGGYRCYAVNADAARYCRTPLFNDAEYPKGVGLIENVIIDGFFCRSLNNTAAVVLESNCRNFMVRNFRMSASFQNFHALEVKNIAPSLIIADGKSYRLSGKTDKLVLERFSEIKIN